jgi:hypothetical protein
MRLFWLLFILFQISLAVGLSLTPFDAAHGSFRHDEREAAFKAMAEHPSPETKATVQRELHLNSEHITRRQFASAGVWIVVLLVLDVACFYGWRNFRQNFGYKSPSA